MDDREYERHRKLVGSIVKLMVSDLWLGQWGIHIEHNKHGLDQRGAPVGSTKLMCVVADWRYMDATISCDCQAVQLKPREDLQRIILHELLHVCVQEMREWEQGCAVGLPHEERVVTHLERVIEMLFDRLKEKRTKRCKTRRTR